MHLQTLHFIFDASIPIAFQHVQPSARMHKTVPLKTILHATLIISQQTPHTDSFFKMFKVAKDGSNTFFNINGLDELSLSKSKASMINRIYRNTISIQLLSKPFLNFSCFNPLP